LFKPPNLAKTAKPTPPISSANRFALPTALFTRPIQTELVVDIDFSVLSARFEADIELLYLWCKEGWQRSALGDFHTQKQALSRFFLAAMVLSDSVLEVIRRELRRVSPDIRIDIDQIRTVLANEVIKREVMEGEKADEAKKKIAKAVGQATRAAAAAKEQKAGHSSQSAETPVAAPADTEPDAEVRE
jgi:hypothetical protein